MEVVLGAAGVFVFAVTAYAVYVGFWVGVPFVTLPIPTSGRSGTRSSLVRDQPKASARNETTSTTAAATANQAIGIGRSARPTIP